jgi:glycosyltransferase involved in cell wall biosynthesis
LWKQPSDASVAWQHRAIRWGGRVRVLLTADPYLAVPPKLYGGIERIVGLLIVELKKRGHIVGLVAHPESTAPVDYLRGWSGMVPQSTSDHVANVRTLLKATREFQPSIVHSFSRLAYLAPLLLRRLPKLMSYQRHTGGQPDLIAAALAGSSLQFTGCSAFIANMGRRAGGTWHAIPNFVDTGIFEFAPTVAADAPLVFLSRVEHIKGPHIAIAVAKKTGRRLLIAGNKADKGPDRDYWDNVIAPEIGRNGIEYVGPVDDATKIPLLRSAAAMIVPIQWDEPFGIVFAEALACGTPVISCARGALPDIVREGVEGFLIDGVEEGCRAVERLSTISRAQCRQRAEAEFSAEVVTARYQDIYQTMVGGPH